jgi:hypothetical protein
MVKEVSFLLSNILTANISINKSRFIKNTNFIITRKVKNTKIFLKVNMVFVIISTIGYKYFFHTIIIQLRNS